MSLNLVMMGFFLVLVELVGFIIACDGTSINSILPIFLDIVVVCFFVFPCVVLHISNDNTETNVGDNGKSENHTCHNEGTHPDSVLHVATSAATHQISSPVVESTAALTTVDFLAPSPFFLPFHNFSFIESSAWWP